MYREKEQFQNLTALIEPNTKTDNIARLYNAVMLVNDNDVIGF